MRIAQKLVFIIESVRSGDRIVVSDWSLLFALRVIDFFHMKRFKIVYRPSINSYYLRDILLEKFRVKVMVDLLLKFSLRKTRLIFQAVEIQRSFEKYSRENYFISANPLGKDVKFMRPKNTDVIKNILFIGRPTYEKGFDRFIRIADKSKPDYITFYHYGMPSDQYRSDNVVSMGWYNTRDIELNESLVVVPSRLEGFPNIVLELLQAKASIIVSKEVAEYFENYPKLYGSLNTCDFDSIDIDYLVAFKKEENEQYDMKELPTIEKYSALINKLFENI